jgi:hypothetical protein
MEKKRRSVAEGWGWGCESGGKKKKKNRLTKDGDDVALLNETVDPQVLLVPPAVLHKVLSENPLQLLHQLHDVLEPCDRVEGLEDDERDEKEAAVG